LELVVLLLNNLPLRKNFIVLVGSAVADNLHRLLSAFMAPVRVQIEFESSVFAGGIGELGICNDISRARACQSAPVVSALLLDARARRASHCAVDLSTMAVIVFCEGNGSELSGRPNRTKKSKKTHVSA